MLNRRLRFFALALLFCSVSSLASVQAESLRENTALKWIPDDASFFSSILRNREQVERVLNSRAYARLMSMPLIQMGITQFQSGFMEENEEFGEFMKQPENQDLIELAKEAFSDEVFFYGAAGFRHLFGMFVAMNDSVNQMQLRAITNGGQVDDDAFVREMLDRIVDELDDFEVPRFVIGFRLNNPSRANAQLERLEELIQLGIHEEPEFGKAYKKETIDGNEWLTLTVSTDMIPWDEIQEDLDDDDSRAGVEKLKSTIQGKQLVVALGLRDNYLVLQAGKSLSTLQGFGKSGGKLIDHEKMAIVRKHADKPVSAVGYIDGELLRSIYRPAEQLDTYVEMAQAGLKNAPIDNEMKIAISKDTEEFASDVKRYYPEMGATALVQYLTDDGAETLTQTWTENLMLDASQPLDILSNVGGSPLMMLAFRAKEKNGEGYKLMSKWLGRFRDYGFKIAEENIADEHTEIYFTAKARTLPLIKKMDRITRNDFIPAFTDGQSALVIDGKMESRQWHLMMPPAAEPLPMLEFAQVSAVANPDQLKGAFLKYAEVADYALEYINEIVTENLEALTENLDGPAQMLPALLQSAKIPRPVPRETENGTVYEFKGLSQLGLDPRISPTAGISNNRFVVSLSPTTTERLMSPTPLAADGPLADNTTKNLASATQIDMAGAIGLVRAWTNYGMATAAELQDEDQIREMIPTVDGILEIMQCYHSIEIANYAENDSMITQMRVRFKDLSE